MDGEKFDDLLKRFCTTRLTRFDALRGLVAGTAAALTGATLASDETDAKKKGGKGRKKSTKRRSGGKKGKKQQRPQTRQQQQELCAAGHVALCHNSTAGNGGVVQCPNGSSTNLAGHCGHNDEDANPFDCYCKDGGFNPNVHCEGFSPLLQECFDCSGDGSCHFFCVPEECPQPAPGEQCKEAACENNACVIRNKPDDTECNDGLFCTVNDVCTGGVCGGTPRDCGDGITCTVDRCDEDANACTNTPDDSACDDGIVCTVDKCDPAAGGCTNTPDDSACPPRPGCDAVCDPDNPDKDENGCVYVCECDASCTLGYYSQNQCDWPLPLDTPFACDPSLTLEQAIQCRGSVKADPVCNTRTAQRAAAILNQAAFGCGYEGDICTASTGDLDAANEHDPDCCADDSCEDPSVCTIGRTCPLQGCGNS